MQQNEINQAILDVGKAFWDDTDLGVAEDKEKCNHCELKPTGESLNH